MERFSAIVARGHRVTGGVARVRAPRQGIVSEIHVRDGQMVERGDVIVTLQSGLATASGANADAA